ncbi:GNAT family N-acetyltransferase [Candidatus Bipolaricaulota bacterium]
MEPSIRLKKPQLDQSALVLADAFADDVMWKGMLPDDDERQRVMPVLWRGVIAYCLRYGIVSTTPDVTGIAAWAKPGHAHPTMWKHLRTGFGLVRSVMLMSKESRDRFIRVMKQIEDSHRELMPQPHWYLWALGVAPEHQRMGIGRSLLAPTLAAAQETGVPCYLETETEGNVAFYSKQGFVVMRESKFPEAGFRLWFLQRTAR